jgi:hypothetical protein
LDGKSNTITFGSSRKRKWRRMEQATLDDETIRATGIEKLVKGADK